MSSVIPRNETNEQGFAIGYPVENWTSAQTPDDRILQGQYCRLEPLDIHKHSEQLFNANIQDKDHAIWTYLPYGPFDSLDEYQQWMEQSCFNGDPVFYAIVDQATNLAQGVASYLRINPNAGSIEVGHINYAPVLQCTAAASEAMYLMMSNAFDMGYRRYEWKCNALNQKSCNAAKRLGFSYEGIFRQMLVVKGRNRDSAWFSLLDYEWPVVKSAFEAWLDPANFDTQGQQRQSLSSLTQSALSSLT